MTLERRLRILEMSWPAETPPPALPRAVAAYLAAHGVPPPLGPFRQPGEYQAPQDACLGAVLRCVRDCAASGQPVSLRLVQTLLLKHGYCLLAWRLARARQERTRWPYARATDPEDWQAAATRMLGVSREQVDKELWFARTCRWLARWREAGTSDPETLRLLDFGPAELALLASDAEESA